MQKLFPLVFLCLIIYFLFFFGLFAFFYPYKRKYPRKWHKRATHYRAYKNGLTRKNCNAYEHKQRFSPPKNGLWNLSSTTDTALSANPTSIYAYCKNFILHSKRKASAKLSLRRCFLLHSGQYSHFPSSIFIQHYFVAFEAHHPLAIPLFLRLSKPCPIAVPRNSSINLFGNYPTHTRKNLCPIIQ